MQAHIPTLFLVIMAASITLSGGMAFVAFGRDRRLMIWAAALALHALAYCLFSLRGLIIDFASVVLANGALSATIALFAEGVFQFQHRRSPRWLIWLPVVATIAGFYLLLDNIRWRILLGCTVFAAQSLFVLITVLERRRETTGRGQYLVAAGATLAMVVFVMRVVAMAFVSPQAFTITSSSPIQTNSFLLTIVSLMLLALGLVVMTKDQAEAAAQSSTLFVQDILDSVSSQIAVIDQTGTIVAINNAWRQFSRENSAQPGQLAPHTDVGTNYLDICSGNAVTFEDEALSASDGIWAVLEGRMPTFTLEYACHSPHEQRWFQMAVTPLSASTAGAVVVHGDITRRKQVEQYEQIRSHALELLAADAPLVRILEALARGAQQLDPRMLCSILLLDSDGRRLRLSAAPSLPDFFNAAIDGMDIGPEAGSCGTAAWSGERVFVADIPNHPLWVNYRELAGRAVLVTAHSCRSGSGAGHLCHLPTSGAYA